ncbi:hypothetical protein [Sphingomonas sp. Ag1]|jgi:hypothetical protein|uniref:hypothetical protein n=1 Tax=Sphingomonas sp. Ag1 TaxID=1642949 RepID=UPI00062139DE|nr:hypothetical protein [Sphingomonas sp. Ag1]KKI20327.1 hypothetical protein XM50_05505 [Sphingomonas sp. Ag1]
MAAAQSDIADPALVSGTSWNVLLQVYIAEGEGRSVSVAWLAEHLKLSHVTSQRWINALLAADVLEVEIRNLAPDTVKCYRLTSATMHRVEEYLAKFSGYSASHRARLTSEPRRSDTSTCRHVSDSQADKREDQLSLATTRVGGALFRSNAEPNDSGTLEQRHGDRHVVAGP